MSDDETGGSGSTGPAWAGTAPPATPRTEPADAGADDGDLHVELRWPAGHEPVGTTESRPTRADVGEATATDPVEPELEASSSDDPRAASRPLDPADAVVIDEAADDDLGDDDGTSTEVGSDGTADHAAADEDWVDWDDDWDDRSEADGEQGEGGVETSPGPLLPLMADRIDVVQGGLQSLAMRLEALVTATGSLRAAVFDRIDEYADAANRLSLNQARDLDEYRRSSERTVAELRQATGDADDFHRRIEARLDELAADIVALTALSRSQSRDRALQEQQATKTRALLEQPRPEWAQELDAQLLDELEAIRELVERLDARPTDQLDPGAELRDELQSIRQELDVVLARATSDSTLLAELHDEVRALRSDVVELRDADPGGGTVDELRAVLAEITGVRGPAGNPPPAADPVLPATIEQQLSEISDLVAAVLDGLPASAENSGADIAASLVALRTTVERQSEAITKALRIDTEAIADTVVQRLVTVFDVDIVQEPLAPGDRAGGDGGQRADRRRR